MSDELDRGLKARFDRELAQVRVPATWTLTRRRSSPLALAATVALVATVLVAATAGGLALRADRESRSAGAPSPSPSARVPPSPTLKASPLPPPPSPSPASTSALPTVSGVAVSPMGPLRGDIAWVVRRTATALPGSGHPGRYELVAVPVAGGDARVAVTWELTGARGGPSAPVPAARQQVSRDGRYFVLSTDARRIVVVDLASGTARQITNDPEYLDDEPVWSADGSKIAFRRARGGLEGGIWVTNADGGEARRIVIGDPSRASSGEPVYDWSPDGGVVCYWELIDMYRCVRTADASLFTVVQNVTGPAPADWRSASPRFVSAFSQRGAGTALLVAEEPRVSGTSRTIATGRAADVEFLSPRWHPTADSVAYVEVLTSGSRIGPALRLFVSELDGARRALQTQGAPREPEWTPSGEEVLFLGGESNTSPVNVGLFAARADGSSLRSVWIASDLVSVATRRY